MMMMLIFITVIIEKMLRSNFTMFYTVYFAFLPFSLCLIKAQDLKFDDEGNVMNNDTPFNFHKLVASKVKGEEESTTITTTTTKGFRVLQSSAKNNPSA